MGCYGFGRRFSYHFRVPVADPIQAISTRPSPLRSPAAQAAAGMAASRVCFVHRLPEGSSAE